MEPEEIPDLIPASIGTFQSLSQQKDNMKNNYRKVPVTIVTGFLGSGKTTLIMNILNDQSHGKRIAVILNEFGESGGIDKSLMKDENGKLCEEWLELGNGCLCCSVKCVILTIRDFFD